MEESSKLVGWDPYSYAGDPGATPGFPGTAKEAARSLDHRQDWARAQDWAPLRPLLWFLGVLKWLMDLQHINNMGSKLLG